MKPLIQQTSQSAPVEKIERLLNVAAFTAAAAALLLMEAVLRL